MAKLIFEMSGSPYNTRSLSSSISKKDPSTSGWFPSKRPFSHPSNMKVSFGQGEIWSLSLVMGLLLKVVFKQPLGQVLHCLLEAPL